MIIEKEDDCQLVPHTQYSSEAIYLSFLCFWYFLFRNILLLEFDKVLKDLPLEILPLDRSLSLPDSPLFI